MTVNQLNQLSIHHPKDLFNAIEGHQYSVALWRLPFSEEIIALTDLRPDQLIEDPLNSQETGFLLNPFANHHPSKPKMIKGDLLVTWNDGKVEVNTDPRLSSDHLTDFEKVCKEAKRPNKKSRSKDQPDYEHNVSEAVDQIRSSSLNKVVLSQYDDLELPDHFDPIKTFEAACAAYPNALIYLVYDPEYGCWMGATPETLIQMAEGEFKTVSLAGTQQLPPEKELSEVAWTQKEIEEQAMVSRYIINCFKNIRLREFTENGPKTVRAAQLAHLKTEYTVDLSAVNMPQLGSVMVDLLHPTSAVCGMPLDQALEFIKKHESYNRELFAGFLGPVNVNNLTHLFVNLRCMQIFNNVGRFYAGAGITEDSNPKKEYEEIQLKMETLKRLIY